MGGSLALPLPELAVRLEGGGFEWAPNALLVSNLDVSGRINKEGLSVPQFSFRTLPKEANGVGIREAKSRLEGLLKSPFLMTRPPRWT